MASSTSKIPLQRSRSFSSSRLSRVPVRTTIHKPTGRSLSRPKLGKFSLDRNFSQSHENLNDYPGLGRQKSGSFHRQIRTPLSKIGTGSVSKSPGLSSVKKDGRPITDKKWQYNQIVKVRNFVAREFPDIDVNGIKAGITIDMFVMLICALLQKIDKRIIITRDNYVEEVPCTLRRYHYMANIKPSLMKTVNTPHAWPHVLAMLSWLTDLISEILYDPVTSSSNDLKSITDNAIFQTLIYWNQCGDETLDINAHFEKEFKNIISTFFNFDEKEIDKLDEELAMLKEKQTAYTHKNSTICADINTAQNEAEMSKSRCEAIKKEIYQLEYDAINKEEVLLNNIKKTDIELEEKLKEKEKLKKIIEEQIHSADDYEELIKEIEALENTKSLKEERFNHHKELMYSYDYMFSDLKREVECKAYEYNNSINALEWENIAFQKLHMRESGFVRSDVLEEIDELVNSLTTINTNCTKQLKNLIEKAKEYNCDNLDIELQNENIKLEKLIKEDAELEIIHNHIVTKLNVEKQSALIKSSEEMASLQKFRSLRVDLQTLETDLQDLHKRESDLIIFQEDLKLRAMEFFTRLSDQIHQSTEEYVNIISEVLANKQDTLNKIIETKQSYINQRKNVNNNK